MINISEREFFHRLLSQIYDIAVVLVKWNITNLYIFQSCRCVFFSSRNIVKIFYSKLEINWWIYLLIETKILKKNIWLQIVISFFKNYLGCIFKENSKFNVFK